MSLNIYLFCYFGEDIAHLAIVLSGTPGQVLNLMPNVENGLFSRFLFYAFEDETEFKHPFKSYKKVNYIDFFNQKGKEIFDLYNMLANNSKVINSNFN